MTCKLLVHDTMLKSTEPPVQGYLFILMTFGYSVTLKLFVEKTIISLDFGQDGSVGNHGTQFLPQPHQNYN